MLKVTRKEIKEMVGLLKENTRISIREEKDSFGNRRVTIVLRGEWFDVEDEYKEARLSFIVATVRGKDDEYTQKRVEDNITTIRRWVKEEKLIQGIS